MAFSLSTSPKPTRVYPVVALREGVVFPHTEAHLTFGRPQSNAGIESALRGDKQVVFVAQRQPIPAPQATDLYSVGTLCTVEQIVPYSNELLALVKGISRVQIGPIITTEPFFSASISTLPDHTTSSDQMEALARQVVNEFKTAFNLGKPVEFPVFMRLMSGVSLAELSD